MSEQKDPKLELQISSSKALVRRMDHQLELVERLLAEAEATHAVANASFTNSLGMKMISCPPGEFLMGSPEYEEDRDDDETQVSVKISQEFWLASTPVTQGQWQALMNTNPSEFRGRQSLPVERVCIFAAQDFCAKLNALGNLPNGYCYSLPTEAQWEYACRAGTNTPFHFGSILNGTEANCHGKHPYGTQVEGPYLEKTTEVRSYPPNNWGLYDMHGNVREWCSDWYVANECLSGGTDPTGPSSGAHRVIRGGSCRTPAYCCRSAHRTGCAPGYHMLVCPGLRVALIPSVLDEKCKQSKYAPWS